MNKKIKLMIVQAKHVGWDGKKQLEEVYSRLKKLKAGEADLIVLPELCPGIVEPIADEAARLKCFLVAGGYRKNKHGDLVNRAVVFNPKGKLISEYVKSYIDPIESAMGVVPGSSVTVFETHGIRVGLLICGDVGLGVESMSALHHAGAELIVVPAAAVVQSLDYWKWHMVVKSLDTGIPICMVNYGGVHVDDGVRYGGGNSIIATPTPKDCDCDSLETFLSKGLKKPEQHLLKILGSNPQVSACTLDLEQYQNFRTDMKRYRQHGTRILNEFWRQHDQT